MTDGHIDTVRVPDPVILPAVGTTVPEARYYLNMRTCTAHVRTHRGAARPGDHPYLDILLPRFRRRDRARSVQVRRYHWHRTVSRGGRRGAGVAVAVVPPPLDGIGVKPAASLRRPVHTIRFALAIFPYLQAAAQEAIRNARPMLALTAHGTYVLVTQ